MNAPICRFGRHVANYVLFFGVLYLVSAIKRDVSLYRSLAFARLLMGTLNLFSTVGDGAYGSAFLSFAIPEILTAILVIVSLPPAAIVIKCQVPWKTPHILLASMSILPGLAHIFGIAAVEDFDNPVSRLAGLGNFPSLPNEGCAVIHPPAIRTPGLVSCKT